jgi:hypothetical protein
MKLKAKLPTTGLGKISLLLIVLALISWLFVVNAQHCLSRDFVEQASPAICWRTTNDYESTITFSHAIYTILYALAIICGSVAVSKLIIRRSHKTRSEYKIIVRCLVALSILLLIFIVTVTEIQVHTNFNNNNYFLNTTANQVFNIGAPLWLIVTASAVTYGMYVARQRKA